MKSFRAEIGIIGVNPFVLLPDAVLEQLFEASGKRKGPIPVKIEVEGHAFIQTLVKFRGAWRLYLNGPMLKASEKYVGDNIRIRIDFDAKERTIAMHPELQAALEGDAQARKVFEQLSPSRRKEIMRYIASLKTAESVTRNVERALKFLRGGERFAGRDKP